MCRTLLAAALTLALAACVSVQTPPPPAVELPERFQHSGPHPSDASVVAFWTGFDDLILSQLIDSALRANHDIRIATARYDQARALLRESRLDQLPVITAHGSVSDERASASDAPGVARGQRDGRRYQVQAEAAWELDFFGRLRHRTAGARATSAAQAADVAAARIAVVGELSEAYFELRGLQARRHVALNNARNQAASLTLLTQWEDAGRASRLDTARAQSQVELTRALVPALDASIVQAIHRIAVLSGRPSDELRERLSSPRPAPALPDTVAVGVPAELLRRRPDIRAAELRLEAATSHIGVATADLFPRFTLGGLIGSRGLSTGSLFERDSETRLIALGIDWSFLDIGRVRARILAAEADAEAHLAHYEQVVLEAWEEAETAIARYHMAHAELGHVERAQVAATEAAGIARLRFEYGAVGFIDVLDAERSALEAEDLLARSRARLGSELVGVYRALAGGWPERIALEPRDAGNAAVRTATGDVSITASPGY